MTVDIPDFCLVVLIGAAGSGKSTFAARCFRPAEVVSSDACRALVADRESDLSATADAFRVLHLIARLRLARRRLTVVDAVSSRPGARRPLLELAREHDCAAVAVVLDVPEDECVRQDRARPGRTVGPAPIALQHAAVRRSLPGLLAEGFAAVHVLRSSAEVAAAAVRRTPLPVDHRRDRGPFDVVGDVRGRLDALGSLLERLSRGGGRRVVFAGDLAGAGPDDLGVVRLAMAMTSSGEALAVRGDLDEALGPALPKPEAAFLAGLPSHLVLAGGRLVVAHAGLRTALQGRDSPRVTDLCLHGEPGWAEAYRGRALVVHAHEESPCPVREGQTVGLSTAGALTALRFPELELVSVPA